MENRAKRILTKAAGLAVAALLFISILVWSIPSLIQPWMEPMVRPMAPDTPTMDHVEIDHFVSESLRRIGAVEMVNRGEEEGVIRGLYRLPRGSQTEMVAQRLRSFAQEAGVELYASPVDGLDLEIRTYAGADLRQQLLLVPDLPAPPRFKKGPKQLDRPLIALIVVGLGDSEVRDVVASDVPITLAVQPFTPFALRTARLASESWHEILAHVPDDLTSTEAQNAVPLASGVWVDGFPTATMGVHDVVVVPADKVSGARVAKDKRILPAQRSERRPAMETLARARHIAVRLGVAAMVVEAGDPDLDKVLAWASRADRDGYRMVLASEAARGSEVQGPNGSVASRSRR